MSRFKLGFVAAITACGAWSNAALPILAQTPTYAPGNSLPAPGEPLISPESTIPSTTIPQSTIPNSTIPQSTIPGGSYPVPENSYSVPSGNPVDPPATVVTPGTVAPYGVSRGRWYPGYWLGIRPYDPPFGGSGPIPYQTNYQGMALPYGGSATGGCNTCQPAVVMPNLDFGRGYDGMTTGW